MRNMSFLDYVNCYKSGLKFSFNRWTLYRKKYKNYVNLMYKTLTRQYPIVVKMRDGNTITCQTYWEVWNTAIGLNIDHDEDIVYVNGLKFYGGKKIEDTALTFIKEDYRFLPVRDKVVVDIGASIGDSSIYFASHGARKVLALEPDVIRFEFAKKNIKTNNFSDKIVIIHAGCTGMNGENYGVKQYQLKGLVDTIHKPSEFMTLEQIINKLEQPPDILKLACAGCEYDVLLNTPEEIIRRFSHIQVQYVLGYRNIKDKLEKCGFQVTFSGPEFLRTHFPNPNFKSNINLIIYLYFGYLYATRK
jgi:FkbM family methyltransferase